VNASSPAQPLTVALIAGESSGDQLGARLMREIAAQSNREVRFIGIGGPLMEAEGLKSLFPMADIAVNGVLPVLKRLPTLLARIGQAARAIAVSRPDVVVHIDAQDFNQRVARRLREALPGTPLIAYVSPTVWAWRPGRARKIAKLYNRLMAVLPFEPAVHRRLGGPDTVYVGHPLMERLADFAPGPADQKLRNTPPFRLLVMPGSRQSEISRLLPLFGEAAALLAERFPGLIVQLPAVSHLRADILRQTENWRCKPDVLDGETAKLAAFRTARAALAASGTVTLELAMARVPTIVAYKVNYIEGEIARRLIKVESASLPNLILGRKLLPEFIDWGWTATDLADSLEAVLQDGEARESQMAGFAEVHALMSQGVTTPSVTAAGIVLEAALGPGSGSGAVR
jgi:lipid-A-disaccharide synthase